MSSSITIILLWTAAISSGLMAGVYFAFSAFIMKAFGNLDTTQSIAAMNSINRTILHSLFIPLFFGSSIVSVLLIVVAFFHWGEAGYEITLLAGIIYLVGMFVCTIAFNVPLNNSLAKIYANDSSAQQVWSHYLKNWTNWNHLRALSSLTTCVLCIWLIGNC